MTLWQALRIMPAMRGLIQAGLPVELVHDHAEWTRVLAVLTHEQARDIAMRLREITKLAIGDDTFFNSCSGLSGALAVVHDTNRIQEGKGPHSAKGEAESLNDALLKADSESDETRDESNSG